MKKVPAGLWVLAIVFAVTLSGCALLQIPGQIIGGIFGMIGKVLDTAAKMPHPPPWMWGN